MFPGSRSRCPRGGGVRTACVARAAFRRAGAWGDSAETPSAETPAGGGEKRSPEGEELDSQESPGHQEDPAPKRTRRRKEV